MQHGQDSRLLLGGCIIGLVEGSGFWGDKTPPPQAKPLVDPDHPDRQFGPHGPNQSAQCDPEADCLNCHPDK